MAYLSNASLYKRLKFIFERVMNFQVLSAGNANPDYGQYNIGPTSSAQYYEGTAFSDVHDDGTTACGQAQAMPAVVSHFTKISDLEGPDGKYNDGKSIEQGSVVLLQNFAAIVPGYVEKSGSPTHVPLAVAGATMVRFESGGGRQRGNFPRTATLCKAGGSNNKRR